MLLNQALFIHICLIMEYNTIQYYIILMIAKMEKKWSIITINKINMVIKLNHSGCYKVVPPQ